MWVQMKWRFYIELALIRGHGALVINAVDKHVDRTFNTLPHLDVGVEI